MIIDIDIDKDTGTHTHTHTHTHTRAFRYLLQCVWMYVLMYAYLHVREIYA